MAEMIVDNQSGWLAPSSSANGLAQALRRALATPPAQRAAMGAQAAETIRQLCDNATIAARQTAFRQSVAAKPPQPIRIAPNQSFPQLCDAIFAAYPRIGLISPWTQRPGDLDPGPTPVTLYPLPTEPIPPQTILRPTLHSWSDLHDANLLAITYPGPPILHLPPAPKPRRRYSGMALIINQSSAFALRWFLNASPPEKFRLLARMLRNPQRLLSLFRRP